MIFATSFLSTIGTIIIILIMLTILISTHELGHLLVAKKFNVYCLEYSIGMGPLLYKNTKHETQFSIRALPIGGYVKIAGEDDENEIKDLNGNPIPQDRLLNNQPAWKRLLILVAGGLINLFTALICFYICLAISGGFYLPYSQVTIENDMPLAMEGMETGDKIIKVETKNGDASNSFEIKYYDDFINAISYSAPTHDKEIQEIKITYQDVSDNNIIKECIVSRNAYYKDNELVISKIGVSNYYKEYNPVEALYGSFEYMGVYFVETIRSFGQLFQGNLENLSGIVGIYKPINEVVTSQAYAGARLLNLISLFGAIAFSLGFINLIPFPALDGGRIFFTIIEMIRKKKLNKDIEARINVAGFIILIVLMIFITIKDIFNLF